MRVGKVCGEPFAADERLGMGIRHRGHSSAKARITRRFCLPLFSIFATMTGPISAVLRTWVPPQGWRSTPDISLIRGPALNGVDDSDRMARGKAQHAGVPRLAAAHRIEHRTVERNAPLIG